MTKVTQVKNEFLGRVPPQDESMERGIIGAVLMQNASYYQVSEIIRDDSFFFEKHRQVWMTISEMVKRGEPVYALSLLNKLKTKKSNVSELTDVEFIRSLTDNVNINLLEDYARIVEAKAIARRAIFIHSEAIQRLYDQIDDVKDILNDAEYKMLDAQRALHTFKNITPEHIANKALEQFRLAVANGGVTGVPCGVQQIDDMIGGWRPGRIYTIGARTRVGKSAVAAYFAYFAACAGFPSLIFSQEMQDTELWNRLASIRLRELGHKIEYSRIDKGNVTDAERILVEEAIMYVSQFPIHIDDTANLSAKTIKAKLVKYIKDYDIRVCFMDYVQISDLGDGNNRADGIGSFMSSLKTTSKELNIPILPLSQMDRLREKGGYPGGHRPQLTDLKGSGGLEENSDVVILLHRPEVFGITEDEQGRSLVGVMEIIIAKHKMGETGMLIEQFEVATNAFISELMDTVEPNIPQNDIFRTAPGNFWKNKDDEDAPF